MPYNYNKSNTDKAKSLRKNMTNEEKKLWYNFLKHLPYTVNRQKTIGQYIVDFYCHSALIAIEIDGSQHLEKEGIKKDEIRDRTLKEKNIMVLRYTNAQVNESFKSVCDDILRNIEGRL